MRHLVVVFPRDMVQHLVVVFLPDLVQHLVVVFLLFGGGWLSEWWC